MARVDALTEAGQVSPAFLRKVTRSLDIVAEQQAKADAPKDEAVAK